MVVQRRVSIQGKPASQARQPKSWLPVESQATCLSRFFVCLAGHCSSLTRLTFRAFAAYPHSLRSLAVFHGPSTTALPLRRRSQPNSICCRQYCRSSSAVMRCRRSSCWPSSFASGSGLRVNCAAAPIHRVSRSRWGRNPRSVHSAVLIRSKFGRCRPGEHQNLAAF